MSDKPKKRFFAAHSKSSAMMVSLVVHAILIVIAFSFVAVTVYKNQDPQFVAQKVKRPKMPPKILQVPVKTKKRIKPKLRKRLVAKRLDHKTPDIVMPEITGVKGGTGFGDGDGLGGLGFDLPEINFFDSKAKGGKVCFIVHFGPATIGKTPYERMTGYTIRKRLEDVIEKLPRDVLFNVACFWMNDTDAMSPKVMLATPENKKMVMDWMAPVNPIKGNYSHNFVWQSASRRIRAAENRWPSRVDKLPFYSIKWAYPYKVPKALEKKYVPGSKGYMHWSRGVAWAILTQKPDTIFILTTNYIDGWGSGGKGQPVKILASYKKMFKDVYGPDRKKWPTINVVVLPNMGADRAKLVSRAQSVLNDQFGPIWKGTGGDGSVIKDISDYMTAAEKKQLKEYKNEFKDRAKTK